MRGLSFEELAAPAPHAPNRADVALFVGFVARRTGQRPDGSYGPMPSILPGPPGTTRTAAPSSLYRWLQEQGWTQADRRLYGPTAGGDASSAALPAAPGWTQSDDRLDYLTDVPVPIDSWEAFDRLFAWDQRPLRYLEPDDVAPPFATSYLGAAVRSFFAQGGRFCYVVSVSTPWLYIEMNDEGRRTLLGQLCPGLPGTPTVDPVDRTTWRGVGHLFGLPDVSFLCLPDLPDLVAVRPEKPVPLPKIPPAEELFVECSEPGPEEKDDGFSRAFAAPRADAAGYALWATVLRQLGGLLSRRLREVQLVASVPLPLAGTRGRGRLLPEADLFGWLLEEGWLAAPIGSSGDPDGFSSAFIQLAWPWVKTAGSGRLPDELESPDAVLIGVLARNALGRGSFRCAAGNALAEVFAVEPGLSRADRDLSAAPGTALIQRVSLLGPTADGMQVLSDVTTSADEAYRQANVNRLVSAIVRAARRLGEEVLFEASGPRLWGGIRASIESLMMQLWTEGALRGSSPSQAFQVRCDRSTMSQQDLDDGRVRVEVSFEAVAAIERIQVALAIARGITSQVPAAKAVP